MMAMGAVFQMTAVLLHSLPCSRAALALAAGVRKAKCTHMTTMMSGISGAMPVAWLKLQPGENLYRYGADAGEQSLQVQIWHRQSYGGA